MTCTTTTVTTPKNAVRRILGRVSLITAGLTALGVTVGLLAPATASAAPKSPCAGVTSPCKIVAHTDVTGDGRKDAVAIVTQKKTDDVISRFQVRVLTPKGVLTKTDTTAGWEGRIYDGATDIDGRPGKDLVVGHLVGAHTSFYRTISYHDGKLVWLEAPKLPKKVGAASVAHSWILDGAVASFAGVHRTTSHGSAVVTETIASRDPDARLYTGWTVKYRWNRTHWTSVSTERGSWTDEQAQKVMGWHVKGLGRW